MQKFLLWLLALQLICGWSISSSSVAFAQLQGSPPLVQGDQSALISVQQAPAKDDASASVDADTKNQTEEVIAVAKAWLQRPELQHSLIGLEIMHLPTGHVMFSQNGRRRFVSASIAKVFSTACAFDMFGPNYRYRTQIVAGGPIRNGVLNGPLVIIPSQDPSFSSEDLRAALACLQIHDIKQIDGKVFVASIEGGGDYFATEYLSQDWGQDWMPVSSDFVLDRNIVVGADAGRGMKVHVVTADGELSALTKTLLKSPWAPAWATYNKSSGTVNYYRPNSNAIGGIVVSNPTDYNAAVVTQIVRQLGVKVLGQNIAISDQYQRVIGEHFSKPLSEIIRFTLKESDNLYAQQLIRTIGKQPPLNKSLEKAPLEDRGLAILYNWLHGIGSTPSEVVLFDGSGLSRKNLVSPHSLNLVLRHMALHSYNGEYIDLMIHEKDGANNSFRYKTGAMDSVRSISGVLKTGKGEPLAVTAIVNAHTTSVRDLRPALHALTAKLESLGALKYPAETVKKSPAKHKPAVRASTTRAKRAVSTKRSSRKAVKPRRRAR